MIIKESKTADTRSATDIVSKETLLQSSEQHKNDIHQAIDWMREVLWTKACNHDFTKIRNIDEFYDDFLACQKDKSKDFRSMDWYQLHITEERHHLDAKVPEDVNLFDVMERIADIVMAGMARTGSVFPDKLPDGLLDRAYQNTIEMLKSRVTVEK